MGTKTRQRSLLTGAMFGLGWAWMIKLLLLFEMISNENPYILLLYLKSY